MANFHSFYSDILRYFLENRFTKFLVVGSVTTLLDLILFYIIHIELGAGKVPANIISYGSGITLGFFLNRAWTFQDSGHRSHKRIIFSLFYGYLGLGINTALLWLFSLYIPVMLAKIAAVPIVVVYNYLTNKYLVFKSV